MPRLIALFFLCFLFFCQAFGQIKREREESITELIASNTMGFGNIWVRSGLSVESKSDGTGKFEPYQAIGLGLSQNMSAWAGAVPFEGGLKKIIGKADAHIKLTLPYNDNLRLFGLAVQGDLILSTEMDTLSKGQDTARPAFTPKIGITAAADLDLIKVYKQLPLKFYVNWSTIDNDRLLVTYQQQSFRFGVEYKDARNSYFLGMKYGLYKQLTGDDVIDGKAGYDENLFMLLPGVRYRILSRFSVLGTALFTVGGTLKRNSSLSYSRYGFRLGLEFPIFFRETNAEAIRAMIFLDKKKDIPEDKAVTIKTRKKNNDLSGLFMPDDPNETQSFTKSLKEGDVPEEREEQVKEKRKKINEELDNIEKLLE